jgi:hypothetical protein
LKTGTVGVDAAKNIWGLTMSGPPFFIATITSAPFPAMAEAEAPPNAD